MKLNIDLYVKVDLLRTEVGL